MTPAAAPAKDLPAIPAAPFVAAVFVSAGLVFLLQPIATRLVLPTLGGSPAVWNTAMVFFQAALLGGYLYAHLLQRLKRLEWQVATHLVLLAAAALSLPLAITGLTGAPDPARPIGWLLGTLALSLGAPFTILSATAPLIQAWFARARPGRNPYALYAASNLGSFLALLAYPLLVEPLAALDAQRFGWTLGYGGFVAVLLWLAWTLRRARNPGVEPQPSATTSPPLAWRERAVLVLLAAAPSSLMLGVTTHLSTDVASAPFLWVVPLALYLLTFVLAFRDRPWPSFEATLALQAAAVAVAVIFIAFRTGEWLLLVATNLAAFALTALLCHQRLAGRRPPPDRLTEFYLWISLGGVLGGAFTALLAPVVFNAVWEYPIVLVLVGLARRWGRGPLDRFEAAALFIAIPLALTPPVLLEMMRYNADFLPDLRGEPLLRLSASILGTAAVGAYLLRDRAPLFVLVLALMAWSSQHISRGYDWAYSERSFFGVMRVARTPDPGLGGEAHVLMHGTTLHGAQSLSPEQRCRPTLYYTPQTPLGQAVQRTQARAPDTRIGVIGQGAGALAAYVGPRDRLTFYEIDPAVDRLSRDPRWFSFISHCAEGPVTTVLGDARLSLRDTPDDSYDVLVVDAFSSDAVPTHLLTVEAIHEYLRVVADDGVVVLHLSNRNLEITLPAQAAAQALGAPALHQIYFEQAGGAGLAEASTEALILSPTEAGITPFREDGRWRQLQTTTVRPWTDDYVNLAGALWRNLVR
jgi:SAM-dependent methyltransferase